MLRKLFLVFSVPALFVGLATPAAADTTTATVSSEYASLFSQYTRQQGLFSQHTLALIAAQFNSELSDEHRNALWYGPTDEAQVQECLEKYGLDGDGPWPDIGIHKDCSVEVIDADLYEEALDIVLARNHPDGLSS